MVPQERSQRSGRRRVLLILGVLYLAVSWLFQASIIAYWAAFAFDSTGSFL